MVYYDSWEQFETAAAGVYAASPDQARYTVKYRNTTASLVLKVTDDTTCVQLHTERLDDIKRIAHLHRILAQAAANRSAPVRALKPAFPETPREEKPAAGKKPQQQQSTAANQGKKKGKGRKRT
ncbi:Signal recognition particle protein [Coemansia interrupta]|uniref:Signal recognition particle protein n=1 Tax=Coemansia interrupta TaxID=1126814 RepID=A0A9W8H465_9FUNG|nr:Signal recognition particle protein [Coemansia interrupta]